MRQCLLKVLMPQPQSLAPNEIHVWEIPLHDPAGLASNPGCCLSPDELARAARFHFPHHRARWMSAHHALRQILARYVGGLPEALRFVTNPHGKPSLESQATDRHIEFNLTHSEDLALLAVARDEVGIDVEYLRGTCDWDRLAERVFTARELGPLDRLGTPDTRTRQFYELWTAKEAYIKARGIGMSLSLRKFSVPLPEFNDAGLVIDNGVGDGRSWYVQRIPAPAGYAAAVAYPRRDIQLHVFNWPLEADSSPPA